MKIGILGSGMIGGTAARLFAAAGHEVAVSNSRGPASLQPLVDEIGPRARAMTIADAARFGDVVLLAVPWRAPEALPAPPLVAGKVVIDAMNPYKDGGGLHDLGDSTSSEETLKRLPGARLVKAFNTIYYKHLASLGKPGAPADARTAIFIAGDDEQAKGIVAGLIDDIGFTAVDTGSLREGGKRQEPNTPIYNRPMTAAEARRAIAAGGTRPT
jgi:8-hydroxy-5-deazaflavin:NADPH oxidoreductase